MQTAWEPLSLWNRFQNEFKSVSKDFNPQELVTAWKSQKNRTIFVKSFLAEIARISNLELECELWKVDYAMSVVSENNSCVPVMFIEAENVIRDVSRAGGEVRKLCCHSAPLKVLITVGEWDEAPSIWKGRSLRSQCLDEWQSIVRDHATVWPHRGLFGVIVGEWFNLSKTTGRLRFYTNAIQTDGSLLHPGSDNIIFERQPMPYNLPESP